MQVEEEVWRLTRPLSPQGAWVSQARCVEPDVDPEIFFPEVGDKCLEAKRICDACPVKTDCLEWAVSNAEVFGIWGGVGVGTRAKIRKARNYKRTLSAECPHGHTFTEENTKVRDGSRECRTCLRERSRRRRAGAWAA